MYYITSKGKEYLDRMLGAGYKIGTESERKQRILGYLEFANGASVEDINSHITRQRKQISSGDMGWAPEGTGRDYSRTISRLEREGMIRR